MHIYLLAGVCSLTIFFIIASIFSALGGDKGSTKKRIKDIKNVDHGYEKKPEKEKVSFKEKMDARLKENKKKKRANNRKKREKNNKKTSVVDGMLETAGLDITAEQFSLIKIFCAAGLMGLGALVCKIVGAPMKYLVLIIAVAGLLGMIIPSRLLKSKINKKLSGFRNELPDIMDLLVVSVEAGLGFDAALLRLYEKNKSPLMQELMQATRDIQRGMSKKEAYENLAKRCNVKELTTFLTAMVQADQLGISIKSVLKVQSENLRKERRQRAEEKALKAPVKMLIPLVIFIFPIIFVILLGPAVVNLKDAF